MCLLASTGYSPFSLVPSYRCHGGQQGGGSRSRKLHLPGCDKYQGEQGNARKSGPNWLLKRRLRQQKLSRGWQLKHLFWLVVPSQDLPQRQEEWVYWSTLAVRIQKRKSGRVAEQSGKTVLLVVVLLLAGIKAKPTTTIHVTPPDQDYY